MKTYEYLELEEIHTENLLEDVKSRLEKNGFSVIIMNNSSSIRQLIEENIPDEVLVALDGRDVIDELNIPGYLQDKWNVIIDPYQVNLSPKIKKYLLEKLYSSEFYITCPDAITKDGKVIFSERNEFLVKGNHEKPGNIIAFVGSDDIIDNFDDVRSKYQSKELTVLEVSPFGLKGGMIDNYGQMEEYNDFLTEKTEKKNKFTIVLLTEEHAF